jgi:lipopolysaccharide export system protein LptA
MKTPLLIPLLFALLAGACGCAVAEKADRNKPMNIESDALRYDDIKQVSIFTGRVTLTKGTIQIRGSQLEVHQDPEGYQFGVVTGTADTLAFFRQKREGLEEFIEGEGEIIEYDGKADNVKFIKKAQLRRLRGATLGDQVSGALIVYDNFTDMFSVDGSTRKGAPGAPVGRVRAMLIPKSTESTNSLAPSGQGAPTLRSTPTLEGAPK